MYAALILNVFSKDSAKPYIHVNVIVKNGRKSPIGFLLNTARYDSKLWPTFLMGSINGWVNDEIYGFYVFIESFVIFLFY